MEYRSAQTASVSQVTKNCESHSMLIEAGVVLPKLDNGKIAAPDNDEATIIMIEMIVVVLLIQLLLHKRA